MNDDSELIQIIVDELMKDFDDWKETLSDEMKLKYRYQNERLFVEVYSKINEAKE